MSGNVQDESVSADAGIFKDPVGHSDADIFTNINDFIDNVTNTNVLLLTQQHIMYKIGTW